MNKKIGLIGEDPNDTNSLKNLLLQKYEGSISFVQLLKNQRGHQLENLRTKVALKIEFAEKKPNLLIVIRDADAIVTEAQKLTKRKDWYKSLVDGITNKSMFLLIIYELESWIIADINTFNKIYNTKINFKKNIHYFKDPKGFLKEKTRNNNKKYKESDAPDLFKKLSFNTIKSNCTVFNKFIKDFESAINK